MSIIVDQNGRPPPQRQLQLEPQEAFLLYALTQHTDRVSVIPAHEITKNIRKGYNRGGRARPGLLALSVPPQVAENLLGPEQKRDVLFLVHIDRAVLERANSPIIVPG